MGVAACQSIGSHACILSLGTMRRRRRLGGASTGMLSGLGIERTNSATSRALPLRDSLCTLEGSLSFLLGFSEVAIVVVCVWHEVNPGVASSRVTCRHFDQGAIPGPCVYGQKLWELGGGLFCSAGGCRASRQLENVGLQGWCGFAATGPGFRGVCLGLQTS